MSVMNQEPEELAISLPSGAVLQADMWKPSVVSEQSGEGNKLAVCLHPWSWLGGRKEDPVLWSLVEPLLVQNYHVLHYNSRGVGNSSGWPSFTGFKEAKDLEDLVQWAMGQISDIRSVLIAGYSHGSLIASLFPVLPSVETYHILISYPLGPRGWLTFFNSSSYDRALKDLLQQTNSNVLIVYGDRDEFTSQSNYKSWVSSLHGNVIVQEVENASHFWRGQSGRELVSLIQRPLPDERPRQSVANLIGRFETQTKRLSLSASSPSRSSSVVSHITGDSVKDEPKEKREWPPKSVSNAEKPPLILPSLSSRNIPQVAQSTSNGSELGTASNWTKDAAEEPEVPLTAKALNASQRQSKTEPNTFLENWRKDIPAQVELEPEAPIPATISMESQVEATTPIPSASQKLNTPTTPRTSNISKATTRVPVTKTPSTKTPPSSSGKALAVSSKIPAKTPLKPSVSKQPATPSIAQPLKPQHTGQSVASNATTRRPTNKAPVTPVSKTPSRPEAASRAKTPTSSRPKTPSTGLFAPTAASLARSRNAAPQVPAPPKKTTISSSSVDRLSKPTAASKARIAAAVVPAPAPKSGGTTTPRQSTSGKAKSTPASSPSKVKKAPTIKPAATASAVVASVAAVGLAATSAEAGGDGKAVEDIIDPVLNSEEVGDNGPVEEDSAPKEGVEAHEGGEVLDEAGEESQSVGSGEVGSMPKSPSPALEVSDNVESGEDAPHSPEAVEDEIPEVVEDEASEVVENEAPKLEDEVPQVTENYKSSKDELEQMVEALQL
ncbi:hypothetical protein JR316_0005945 [Psilocybe cubensis]|uniref:Uncharacterized protein n=2 Tax=Psilocybe cubensis TaxID=181762 RepID=A0ACB8H0Q1_PSICU|nr:hypothetical protein JR316_0005945 [Psilocybe cubensis]KAH9481419.1 hypothetical protein JR316_0005945 [Psilocybe cubensis]